jgi:hypothetical protein
LISKEKPRLLKGTGLEFDKGETLEVSCLTTTPTRNAAFSSAPDLAGAEPNNRYNLDLQGTC